MSTWEFCIVEEGEWVELDEDTVRQLAILGAREDAPRVETVDDGDEAWLSLNAPDGTPPAVVHAVLRGMVAAIDAALNAADNAGAPAAEHAEWETVKESQPYEPPSWYLTLDDYLGLLRDTVAETFADGRPHHPEDLYFAVSNAAQNMDSAFTYVAERHG